ncbi:MULTISPECIES: CvpA family protein [Bacteria]|uniref:CvpA family protein n=1 Tax=Bacteria TaxID=2 RepID=UPI00103FBE73|nr:MULTISPECIES: CvpA family protein [Bacteria]QDM40079.1 CvpA family protein [Altererythrobacter sp. TH136]TCJ37347.1 CvpA family protein [Parafrankia sp. BMG5.11]
MTGFDIIVLLIVAVAAVGGFMRGFVQEVLSLVAWAVAILAIHNLHTPLYDWLVPKIGNPTGAATLAFAMLLLIPYAGMKLIAGRLGESSRASMLGPIDRVLGFGFGAIKGAVVVTCGFALLVLGYDAAWGIAGRPDWIKQARTYPLINASADALVKMIENRNESVANSDSVIRDQSR